MIQWREDGEEVLENSLQILRGWGNTSVVPRRSRGTRRYCLNLEGWGGNSPIPPSRPHAINIVIEWKIKPLMSCKYFTNFFILRTGEYWANTHLLNRWVLGQYSPVCSMKNSLYYKQVSIGPILTCWGGEYWLNTHLFVVWKNFLTTNRWVLAQYSPVCD